MREPNADLPIDPNVKTPAAVRRSVALADQAFESQNPKPVEEVTPESNPPVEKPSEVVEKPAEGNPPAEKPRDWENDYKAMEGRFKAEQKQNRELVKRLTSLESLVANLQASQNEAPVASPKLVTEQEENEFGKDFLEVVGKKTKETVGGELGTLKNKVRSLETQLATVTAQSVGDARAKLYSKLDEKIPNWREINTRDDFLGWLALPDRLSGAIRHTLLKDAFDQNDSARVLAFFKGFLKEATSAPTDEGVEVPVTPAPKPSLEQFAAPGRAKTSAAPSTAPGDKPHITRAQVKQFYDDVQKGRYRGREQEQTANEAMIFAAMNEGRIV